MTQLSRAFDNAAVFHDEVHLAQCLDVFKRVFRRGDDVSGLPGGDGAARAL